MVIYELTYRVSTKVVKIYDKWDVRDLPVVYDWHGIDKSDVGKFIAFDDGSELYTKILGVSRTCVGTEIGKFRIDDIVHCCVPKWPNANYSGAIASEESLYVRPASPREKGTATRLLNGEDIPSKYITERIKMITIERLRELAEERGISGNFFMQNIHLAASNPEGKNFQFSMKFLIRLLGDDKLLAALGESTKQIGNGDNGSALGKYIGSNKNKELRDGEVTTTMNIKTLKSLIKKVDTKPIQEAIVVKNKEEDK